MKSLLHKIIALCLLPAMVTGIILYTNFFHYRRGWHSISIQYSLFFWLARLLLAPSLTLFLVRWGQITGSLRQFFSYQLAGLAGYMLMQGLISFILCRLFLSDYDGRIRNLVDIIRSGSLAMNLVVYAFSAMTILAWTLSAQRKAFRGLADRPEELPASRRRETPDQQQPEPASQGLLLKIRNQTFVLEFDEIICLVSKGPYVQIIAQSGRHLMYSRLYELEQKLPPQFIRIHRSHIVNTRHISSCRPLLNGDQLLVLENGQELRSSRTYREKLKPFLG